MRIKGLDGLRAIAFLLVFFFHARFGTFGWMGVQMFFVLSGFLITGILLDMKRLLTSGWYFVKFYGRRFLRIIPLYYFYLFLITQVAAYFFAQGNHKGYMLMFKEQLPYALGYVYNFFMATSKFEETSAFLTHLWSLAVEEQFYILWPLVIFLVPFKHLKKAFWAAIILSPLFRLGVLFFYQRYSFAILGDAYEAAYALPFSHLDAFAVGAMLTFVPKIPKAKTQFFILLALLPVLGMLTDYLTVGVWNIKNSFGWQLLLPTAYKSVWGYSALNYLFMLLIYGVAREKWFVGFLDQPWLRYLGKISYGLYVYHYAIYWIFTQILFPQLGLITGAAGSLALTIVIASISYHAFEWPIDSLKDRWFPFERKSGYLEAQELA